MKLNQTLEIFSFP